MTGWRSSLLIGSAKMPTVLWFLKRKRGLGVSQFREHYEHVHSVLGQKYFGHLFLAYRRHYDRASEDYGTALPGIPSSGFDCIAEWVLRDEEALSEWLRISSDPLIGKIFDEDGARFLDRTASRMAICDTEDTGTRCSQ